MTDTKPAPLGAWTDDENDIIARRYLRMLAAEISGGKYVKAAERRAGLAEMAAGRADRRARTHGSWEMKCCNVSAVLHAADITFIDGYKPLGHGQQRALARAIRHEFIAANLALPIPLQLSMQQLDNLTKLSKGQPL